MYLYDNLTQWESKQLKTFPNLTDLFIQKLVRPFNLDVLSECVQLKILTVVMFDHDDEVKGDLSQFRCLEELSLWLNTTGEPSI